MAVWQCGRGRVERVGCRGRVKCGSVTVFITVLAVYTALHVRLQSIPFDISGLVWLIYSYSRYQNMLFIAQCIFYNMEHL